MREPSALRAGASDVVCNARLVVEVGGRHPQRRAVCSKGNEADQSRHEVGRQVRGFGKVFAHARHNHEGYGMQRAEANEQSAHLGECGVGEAERPTRKQRFDEQNNGAGGGFEGGQAYETVAGTSLFPNILSFCLAYYNCFRPQGQQDGRGSSVCHPPAPPTKGSATHVNTVARGE